MVIFLLGIYLLTLAFGSECCCVAGTAISIMTNVFATCGEQIRLYAQHQMSKYPCYKVQLL